MVLMLKHLSARGSLFLFARTHHHLAYYFNLTDTRHAANDSCIPNSAAPLPIASVVEFPRPRTVSAPAP
jgi:hypothetical protein